MHPQIHSYDFGTELQLDITKYEDFAKLFVTVQASPYGNPGVKQTLLIQVIDKVLSEDGKMYLNEVLSDTNLICYDLIATLKYNRLISRDTSISLEPVTNQHDNVLSGWQFTIDISTDYPVSSCDLPIDLDSGIFDETFDNTFN